MISPPSSGLMPSICTSSTRPSNPYIGEVILETDTGNLLSYWDATIGWRAPWNIPLGRIAYSEAVVDQTGIGASDTDLTSLTLTPSAQNGRIFLFQFQGRFTSTVTSLVEASLVFGLNTLSMKTSRTFTGAETRTLRISRLVAVSGTQTWKVRASTSAGSLSLIANASQPAMFQVREVGGSRFGPWVW